MIALVSTALTAQRQFSPPVSRPPIVAGRPYSAEHILDALQTLRDGTDALKKISRQRIFRDGSGRVRTEELLGSSNDGPMIRIDDVVAGYQIILDTKDRVAHRFTYPGDSSGSRLPASSPPPKRPQVQSTHEELGTRIIEGLEAQGRKDTLAYPAGAFGYDRPVTTVHEVWWSKDLSVILLSKNAMPEQELISRLTNVKQTEPDPALFEVPAGYRIVDHAEPFNMKE